MDIPSYISSFHKFNGTKFYFGMTGVWFVNQNYFIKHFTSVNNGIFIGIYHPVSPKRIELRGGMLVEAIGYDDGSSHLFVVKKADSNLDLYFPYQIVKEEISGITLAFICTVDEIYLPIFRETIAWYKEFLPENYEISVVLFGDSNNVELPNYVKVQKAPMEKFHMSYARNQSLVNASHDHVFMLDVDVRMTLAQIESIVNKFNTIPHHGVFNLKNTPTVGNGLYFGNRHIMIENGFDERFQKFWAEDTEFLMNFSRKGIVPVVVFENFIRIDHSHLNTFSVGTNINNGLMAMIMNSGSRILND